MALVWLILGFGLKDHSWQGFGEPNVVPGIQPKSAAYKTSVLPAVVSLSPNHTCTMKAQGPSPDQCYTKHRNEIISPLVRKVGIWETEFLLTAANTAASNEEESRTGGRN